METFHQAETSRLNITEYPEKVSESKSAINPQDLFWALIAGVLYAIYYQQHDRGTTLGIIQLTLIIAAAIMAIVKLLGSNRKLTYTPTGSLIAREERYYNLALEHDIRQCLREGNISRLNALKTDDAGGIMIEVLTSKDKLFTAIRMQKYHLEGYLPETEWMTLNKH